jgi:cobalt/nickel transport system permease protein
VHHASIDRHAGLESPVHRLDARAKLLATLGFTAAAISEPRTEFAGLLPYLVPPLAVILISGVPLGFVFKRVLIVSPFALVVAGLNPIFETELVTVTLGPLMNETSATVRLGFVTGSAILLKFLISVLALLALATTTRLHRLAGAMSSLGLPRLLAMQVAFLYRYLFVVIDEFERRRRAVDVRTIGRIGFGSRARAAGSALAGLFARSLDRAERVTAAMCARGFDGTLPRVPGARLRLWDVAFVLCTVALAAGLRLRGLWLEG